MFGLVSLVATAAFAPLAALQRQLDADCSGFHGRIGYAVADLRSGKRISNHADDLFPTASTIKTALALEVMKEVDEGKLKWTDTKVIPDQNGREASMWAYFMKDGTVLTVDGSI